MLPLLIPLLFSAHQLLVRAGRGEVSGGVYLSLLVSTILLSPSLLKPTLEPTFLSTMSLAGILHFLIARTCFYHAISRVGANVAASISSTRIFFAILFGLALGEELTAKVAAMTLLIFAGIFLLYEPGKKNLVGMSLALLTAVFSAASSFVVKLGLKFDANPIFGTFLGFAVSTALLTPFYARKESSWHFAAAGVVVAVAHVVRYVSLETYPIVIVEPITASYPLFTIILSYVFLRDREVFSTKLVVGAILVFTGLLLYFV
ncbi:MAG: EamA family transporter [Archaeoglobaceae archaeon]